MPSPNLGETLNAPIIRLNRDKQQLTEEATGMDTTQTAISYDDFAKLDLRIATIAEAAPHPNADKLLVLQIDVGGERRQICAGIKQHYEPAQLVGKQIVIVANLEPRAIRGQMSQGMLLAASDPANGKVVLLTPAEGLPSGAKVK